MNTKTTSTKIFTISSDIAGQRIDNFLHTKLKGVPRNMIYRILRTGKVRINKKRIKPKYKLLIGDKIRIPPVNISFTKDKNTKSICFHSHNIQTFNKIILYEDEHILVLNKPSGIAVHGGSGLNFGIIEWLRILRPEICFLELVHRLDRDTSGVLLLAKKRSSLLKLHKQIREQKVQKEYLALVRGYWKSHLNKIQIPLLKNILRNGKRIVCVNSNGKISEGYFTIEERYTSATLIRCKPITGRTHQIRVHAKYVGHPIAFDNKYGDCTFNKQLISTGLTRLFLHALVLKFIHPHTGNLICIQAPLDTQLQRCLELLRNESCY